MKKSKFIFCLLLLVVCICNINDVKAASIFDTKENTGVYKASDDDSIFDIPFVRIVAERTEIDREISQLGMIISN